MGDQTALSYWFPKIEAAGLPVPKTKLVEMSDAALRDIWRVFDHEPMVGDAESFFKEVERAALDIGFPIFLRSDYTSGKHEWSTTCFTCTVPDVKEHIKNILYFSACVGIPETKTFAVREILPIKPFGICLNYCGMPVNREFRFFVKDGEISCFHPYWPRESLVTGRCLITDTEYRALCEPPPESVSGIAKKAGALLGGDWSVDLLETGQGWYLTDMALAAESFHWSDCEKSGLVA